MKHRNSILLATTLTLFAAFTANAATESEIKTISQNTGLSLSGACIYSAIGTLKAKNFFTKPFGNDQFENFDANYQQIITGFQNIVTIASTVTNQKKAQLGVVEQIKKLKNAISDESCTGDLDADLLAVANANRYITVNHRVLKGMDRITLQTIANQAIQEASKIKEFAAE